MRRKIIKGVQMNAVEGFFQCLWLKLIPLLVQDGHGRGVRGEVKEIIEFISRAGPMGNKEGNKQFRWKFSALGENLIRSVQIGGNVGCDIEECILEDGFDSNKNDSRRVA